MSARTDTIAAELLALRTAHGVINPVSVVQWARKNRKSRLHAQLDWDDGRAGEKYRIWQVRALIAVHVVDAGGGRRFVSLSVDRSHDGSNGYRSLDEIVGRPDLRDIMMSDALAELERVQLKYQRLSELQTVWEEADRVRKRRRTREAA
jgi:hypothetical protein